MLWLFTDARLPDPLAAAAALPSGLGGVVLRQQDAVLGARLARLCRARRLVLTVAGDTRLAARLKAGVHLRDGRWPGLPRQGVGFLTSSAHDAATLRRALRAGAQAIFLSPAFATASHPGAVPHGPVRWARLAAAPGRVFALGGMTGGNVKRLARKAAGVGAVAALR